MGLHAVKYSTEKGEGCHATIIPNNIMISITLRCFRKDHLNRERERESRASYTFRKISCPTLLRSTLSLPFSFCRERRMERCVYVDEKRSIALTITLHAHLYPSCANSTLSLYGTRTHICGSSFGVGDVLRMHRTWYVTTAVVIRAVRFVFVICFFCLKARTSKWAV